jgi:hypothetical protein
MSNYVNNHMRLSYMAAQAGWYKRPANWPYGGEAIPVAWCGVPGAAKSQGARVIARSLAVHLERQRKDKYAREFLKFPDAEGFYTGIMSLPQTSPHTIEGIPIYNKDKDAVIRKPISHIREVQHTKYGLILADEILSAPQTVGGAFMTFIQDGLAGDEYVDTTCARFTAYNPPDIATAGREWTAAEINRWLVMEWTLARQDSRDFITGGNGLANHETFLPPDWEKHVPRAAEIVAKYWDTHPEHINLMESARTIPDFPVDVTGTEPWASERSWTNFIRMYAACLSVDPDPVNEMVSLCVEGFLGRHIQEEVLVHLRNMVLPDPEEILAEGMKPKNSRNVFNAIGPAVMSRPDRLTWCLNSVSKAAQNSDHPQWKERWYGAWNVVEPIMEDRLDQAQEAAQILCNNMPPGASSNIPDAAQQMLAARRAAGVVNNSGKA